MPRVCGALMQKSIVLAVTKQQKKTLRANWRWRFRIAMLGKACDHGKPHVAHCMQPGTVDVVHALDHSRPHCNSGDALLRVAFCARLAHCDTCLAPLKFHCCCSADGSLTACPCPARPLLTSRPAAALPARRESRAGPPARRPSPPARTCRRHCAPATSPATAPRKPLPLQ